MTASTALYLFSSPVYSFDEPQYPFSELIQAGIQRLQALQLRCRHLARQIQQAREKARRQRLIAQTQVDTNAQCPACGHRNGKVAFNPLSIQLVHTCQVCQAVWGEKPIVLDCWPDPATILQGREQFDEGQGY